MTPLKPIENTTRVRGVPSKRYPPNTVCAHPECSEPVESMHHIFGRPPGPDSDSWFVQVGGDRDEHGIRDFEGEDLAFVIPHAIGLCGSGTTGHHGDVEEHRAWIKLEDGVFVWYDRDLLEYADEDWHRLGPLNPQPGSVEGKPKRKRYQGEARRKRKVISIKVPNDEQENGGQVWDELIENVRNSLRIEGLDGDRPVYYILVDALNDWLNS